MPRIKLRVRLKDIADRVGCSVPVVSHVLNHSSGKASCSEELAGRIREKARALQYIPHAPSRALRRKSSRVLGIYVADRPPSPLWALQEAEILKGIRAVCRERAYDILLLSPDSREAKTPAISGTDISFELAAQIAARRTDAVLFLHLPEKTAWLPEFLGLGIPCAAVNYTGAEALSTVNFDDRAATFLAVRELVKLGHRWIGYLGAFNRDASLEAQRRLDGFLGGMAESRLQTDARWIFERRYTGGPSLELEHRTDSEVIRSVAERYAARPAHDRPTAFISYSDYYALQFLGELRRLGLHCPEDLSIVGLDDHPLCRGIYPRLSTIRQPLARMGERVTRYLLDRFENERRDALLATRPVEPPLRAAELTRNPRGKRPSGTLRKLLENEAEEREQQRREAAEIAAEEALYPPPKRFLQYAKPEFILRETSISRH